MHKYLKEPTDSAEYRGLDRVVELFDGLNDLLCYTCQQLVAAKKKQEAKGIYVRHNLKPEDFVKAYAEVPKKAGNFAYVGKELEQMKYDPNADYVPRKDLFEPVSTPSKEYLRLPVDVKISFIGTD